MITIDSQYPPLGLWFIALDDKTDFMGCLAPLMRTDKTPEPGSYTFDFRFRYHKDDLVFDSEDVKSWYHVETRESTPDNAIAKIREVVLRLAEMQSHDGPRPPDVDELLYRNYPDFQAFLNAFQNKPYAYAKLASKEYAAELMKGGK
jgi:hypothetical protein